MDAARLQPCTLAYSAPLVAAAGLALEGVALGVGGLVATLVFAAASAGGSAQSRRFVTAAAAGDGAAASRAFVGRHASLVAAVLVILGLVGPQALALGAASFALSAASLAVVAVVQAGPQASFAPASPADPAVSEGAC